MSPLDPPRRQTILVVDDTPDNVHILVGLLNGIFRVKVAANGPKALEVASSEDPPDLILLDVMMPGMDGYEVCRRLKADPGTREIPVLFLTALTELKDEARGFASGAADYISKPFSPPLVLARVRTQLEQRRLLAAERELLEKTTQGALGAILEMIAMNNPEAADWNQRLGDLASAIARQLGADEPWMIGLAAVLSRIGTLTLPDAVLAKVRSRSALSVAEREAYNRVPEVGYRILKKIPRMEEVAEMVYYSQKNYRRGGFPPDERYGEDIPLGARILRVCLDFMTTLKPKDDPGKCATELLCNLNFYDPEVTIALKRVVDAGFFPAPDLGGVAGVRELAIEELQEGQILDSTVATSDGQILMREGTVLGAAHLEKLANFAMIGAVQGPIAIRTES